MAGIWNINSVYDVNTRTVSRKLSFEVGQNFLARIVNLDKLTGEMLLKLLDGWQFSAKLENPMEKLPEGLVRFVVEGFEDGKLQLKILNSDTKQKSSEKDSISAFLKEKSINLSDSDYDILNKMVKHNITLTKENISDVKTILDFMNKIKSDSTEENAFIDRYIQSKNISLESDEGIKIKNTLKSFFNELKSLESDDLFTFFENNIDLTEENIKSFNNVFKENLTIFKDVKQVEGQLKAAIDTDSEFAGTDSNLESITQNNKELSNNEGKEKIDLGSTSEELVKLNKSGKNNLAVETTVLKELSNESEELFNNTNLKGSNNENEDLSNNTKVSKEVTKVLSEKDIEVTQELKLGDSVKDKSTVLVKHNTIEDISKVIKEQINAKTEELKNTIKTFIEQKSELDPKVYNNVMQALDKNINDFKIFNSVSNQYYYLDLPINIEKHEYECKLMIKDERKKGKKIDSTNVKIAASVNTINMGVVDAYIKVNNNNMDLSIKCNEEWIKVLDNEKEKIMINLHEMGYNVYANVSEREKEMNITNCSEFFGDSNLSVIDTKV